MGGIKILRRKFIVSQCRKFSYGNPLLLHYFRVPKKIGEEGGSIKIFRRKFFVSQCRKFSQGNPLVFTNCGNRKILWLKGLFHDFLLIFLSHSAENIGR